MHGAVVPIGYAKLTSAGSFSFISIPQTYQDLMLIINSRNDSSALTDFGMKLNNNQSITASYTILNGDGSSATSSRGSNPFGFGTIGYSIPNIATSGIFATQIVHLLNYRNTSNNKTAISRSSNDQNGSGNATVIAGLWPLTAAITQIDFSAYGGTNFAANSTATLYGVRSVGQ